MGLISPGKENLLDFLELQQVLSTYDGDIRDPLLWPHEREVPIVSREHLPQLEKIQEVHPSRRDDARFP